MATRMQQRRGTAAQWISTNSGNGPVLNAGEIGWESDTNKFKIGDGVNNWLSLDYFSDINSTVNPAFGSSITFEGASADAYETTLTVVDPTAARTITLPNVTGTVITTGNLSDITNIGVFTSTIVMEGSTADDHELTLSAGNPTADRTITFPDATGTVALVENLVTSLGSTYLVPADLSDTVAELNASGNLLVPGASIIIEGSEADAYETTLTVVNPTAARTITFPNETGTVALAGNVAALSGATFTGAVSGTDLTLSGNLTVNGTTTNINSTNLVVEDKNIVLGDTETPSDATADGGGITLKGTTDKTFNWVDATDAWTSSEHINLASGKTLKYNGTDLVAAQSGNSGKYLTTDGTSTSWGTVAGYSAPTLGSTSIASGATVTTISGLTDIVLNGAGSVQDELTLLLMGAL